MRLLFVALILLLTMATVQASSFQFDMSTTPFEITSSTKYERCQFFENIANNTWVTVCRDSVAGKMIISQWDKLNPDTAITESYPDVAGGYPCDYGNGALIEFTTPKIRLWCGNGALISSYSDYNLWTRTITRTTLGSSFNCISCNRTLAAESWNGGYFSNVPSGGFAGYHYQTTLLSTIPSTYNAPTDLKVAYCGNRLHLAVLKANVLTDLILDTSLNYKSATILSGGLVTDHGYSVSCDNVTNTLVVAYADFYNDHNFTIASYAINGDSLTQIYANQYDIATYDVDVQPTDYFYTDSMMAIVNKDYYHFMLYSFYNGGGFFGGLRILPEANYCICSDWINYRCYNDVMNQTRTCVPSGCSPYGTVRYAANEYCSLVYNRTQGIYTQKYEVTTNTSSCQTDWLDVGQTAECSPQPLVIPSDCLNPNTTNEASTIVDYYPIIGVDGYYQLTSCNPSYNCFTGNYSCVYQLNVTSPMDKNDYLSGDAVTGLARVYYPLSCKNNILGIVGGVKRFKVVDTLTMTCSKPCSEKTFCLNNDYQAAKHTDCSVTNITLCANGCADSACRSAIDTGSALNKIFNWNGELNISPVWKLILWTSASLVLTVLLAVLSISLLHLKKLKDSSLTMFGFLFLIFFLIGCIAGWINWFIPITLVIIFGIILLMKH